MSRQRPLLPFEFHGDVRQDPSYEYLAGIEEAAKRGRARPMPTDQQRRYARAEQSKSGIYVRVDRPVANYADFVPQMRAWDIQEAEGNAVRRKLGVSKTAKRLELTLLDTRSQTLGYIDESLTQEDLERRLQDSHPELFQSTGQIAYTGLELFGATAIRPWVALSISPAARSLHEERRVIRETVAPGTRLSSDHIRDDQLHTSLGDITVHDVRKVAETFEMLKQGIAPLLPEYIEYGPIRVSVGQNPQE